MMEETMGIRGRGETRSEATRARLLTTKRALDELRRLDEEVARLEQMVKDEPIPLHEMLLQKARSTRACARRALTIQKLREGLPRRRRGGR
jgi:hypothetical protein